MYKKYQKRIEKEGSETDWARKRKVRIENLNDLGFGWEGLKPGRPRKKGMGSKKRGKGHRRSLGER